MTSFGRCAGGGGNFGIASSFEFQVHPVGPMITGGLVAHPIAKARDVLRFYRELTASAVRRHDAGRRTADRAGRRDEDRRHHRGPFWLARGRRGGHAARSSSSASRSWTSSARCRTRRSTPCSTATSRAAPAITGSRSSCQSFQTPRSTPSSSARWVARPRTARSFSSISTAPRPESRQPPPPTRCVRPATTW